MVGWFGLWKILNSASPLFCDFSSIEPFFTSQPPLYFSWSSHAVGKPVPGLVSTLFHHMYSVPLRSVQMFLQAMEQVWQPMHLSRWNTIEICDRTFIEFSVHPATANDQRLTTNNQRPILTTSTPATFSPAHACRGCSR